MILDTESTLKNHHRARCIDSSNRLLAALCYHHPDECPETVDRIRSALHPKKPPATIEMIESEEDIIADSVARQHDRSPARHFWPEISPETLSVAKVQRYVCEHYHISRMELLSHRRTMDVVVPRQIAMYLAKTLTLRSLPEIGRRFGGRDHTTVLHAVKKIGLKVETDADFAAQMQSLQLSISGT